MQLNLCQYNDDKENIYKMIELIKEMSLRMV